MNAPVVTTTPDRSKFLGGSDAAAVMGLSPWATPVELWMQKTGRKPKAEPDARQQRIYDRGHRLEPFIRDMVMDKLRDEGVEVELLACNERYVDPEHGFLSCEIDFELAITGTVQIGDELVAMDREHVNADAKSVSGFARKKWGEENTEDVPIEYAAQFMHGLMITGRRYCLVAALRSFDDVDIYWTVRDDETIAAMRPKLVSFWLDHVVADVAPDPMVFDDIKALFPLDNGLCAEATPEIAELVGRYRVVKAQLSDLEKVADELKFRIADFISPHSMLTYEGQPLMTWKGQPDKRLDVDAFRAAHPDLFTQYARTKTVRVLRFASKKGTR